MCIVAEKTRPCDFQQRIYGQVSAARKIAHSLCGKTLLHEFAIAVFYARFMEVLIFQISTLLQNQEGGPTPSKRHTTCSDAGWPGAGIRQDNSLKASLPWNAWTYTDQPPLVGGGSADSEMRPAYET